MKPRNIFLQSRRGLVGLLVFALAFGSIGVFSKIQAAVCTSKDECKDKIAEYEAKLSEKRTEKNNLASQISLISTRVELKTAQLQETQVSIEETTQEIDELGGKIEQLDKSLDNLSRVLLQKIVQGYKNKEVGLMEIVLASDASTLTNQLKYIQRAQENDRTLALRTQQVKSNYSEQKDLRESKVARLEELEVQLEQQQRELDHEISQKESLLEQTKNDETKYQQLLSQALSEYEAVNKAVENGKAVGPVKKGDPIALVGNSGYPFCSTGAHLHFEVRQGDQWVDPGNYLGKEWDWPLSEPIVLTQGFGKTEYSWRYAYSGYIHTGYDMVSRESNVIRAVADGTLFTSQQQCQSAVINIKYIEHDGGLRSFYLHVQ